MKIISKKKWEYINSEIENLRQQVSDLADENVNLNSLTGSLEKETSELIEKNSKLSLQLSDLEYLKAENKKLKSLCTKNGINYKKERKK